MRMLACMAIISALSLPGAALADQGRVTSEAEFVRLVEGRTLSTLGVKLEVTSEGHISGRAWGRDVTGTWRWQDGYFCREMSFGEKPVEPDCQLVRQEGEALRFIAERGAGQQARLALR